LVWALGNQFELSAQSLTIQILSSESLEGIKDANLLDIEELKVPKQTNAEGYVEWPILSSAIEVKALGFRTDTFSVNGSKASSKDTLFFLLFPDRKELLDEVSVFSEVSWLNKVSIKAFEPYDKQWLFITRKELIATSLELKELDRVPLDGLALVKEELFRDVFGNVFLLGRDSVMQLRLEDGKIQFFPKEPRAHFNFAIRSVLGKTKDDNRILRNTRKEEHTFEHTFLLSGIQQGFAIEYPAMHNCGLELVLFRNQMPPFLLYQSLDTACYVAAQYYFRKWVGATLKYWSLINDSGIVSSYRKEQMVIAKSIYENMYARELDVFWLQLQKGNSVLFDPFAKQLVFMNPNFQKTEVLPFAFDLLASRDYLIRDLVTQKTFVRLKKKGGSSLVELDLAENKPQFLKEYSIQAYAQNLRIHNGILMYLNDRNNLQIKRI